MVNLRRLTVIAHDLVATPAAILASYFLRTGDEGLAVYASDIAAAILVLTPAAFVTYWLFGLYRGVWRFASVPDLMNIVKAVTALALLLTALDFATRGEILVPRTVPAIYWLVQILALAGPRILYRVYRDRRFHSRAEQRSGYRIPVLIAGTGEEAEQTIRRLETGLVEPMQPVGLITHKPGHVGERLRNVPVLGLYSDLDRIVETLRAQGQVPRRLVFTREALNRGAMIDDMLAAARSLGLTAVKPAGGFGDLDEARKGELRLAPVAIEDLLGREMRALDLAPLRALIQGRRVVVTGGGGSIGAELCRQIAAMAPERLMILDASEHALYQSVREVAAREPEVALDAALADIRAAAGLKALFEVFRPALVFHAAAIKHVDIVEAHPVEAAHINTLGTRNVAEAAIACDAMALVSISTDKAVNPVSVLGATKRASEVYCADLDQMMRARGSATRFLSVRFGNVLGSSGSVVPLFREQLARGGPLTVTHPEVERYFMTIGEAVTLVLMASALGVAETVTRHSTFVLDMGQPIRIVDLATQMIRLAGFEPNRDIPIEFTGLRPGERLKEYLEKPDEVLAPTATAGVMAVASSPLAGLDVSQAMRALDEAVAARDRGRVQAAICLLVPEYRDVLAERLAQVAE